MTNTSFDRQFDEFMVNCRSRQPRATPRAPSAPARRQVARRCHEQRATGGGGRSVGVSVGVAAGDRARRGAGGAGGRGARRVEGERGETEAPGGGRDGDGEPVRVSVAAYVDCFHMQEENDKIEEVFSTFIKNETSLAEEDLLKQLTSVCSEEDLKPFLHL